MPVGHVDGLVLSVIDVCVVDETPAVPKTAETGAPWYDLRIFGVTAKTVSYSSTERIVTVAVPCQIQSRSAESTGTHSMSSTMTEMVS